MGTILEKLQAVLDSKNAIKQALINKGRNPSNILASYANEIDSIQLGIPKLYGTLSFSGTYATSEYINQSGCRMGCNENGEVFIILRAGTSTAYENIVFNLASAPAGISLLQTTTTATSSSNTAGNHYGCCLVGVTKKINVAVALDTRNATNDYVRADLIVTYAED